MVYYYVIIYKIYKNDTFYINQRRLDFREIVEFIAFEYKKHNHNFKIVSIKPWTRYGTHNKF